MNKRSIVSLAVAASLANVYPAQAQIDRNVSSFQSLIYASELEDTSAQLQFSDDLRIEVPVPAYNVSDSSPMFVRIDLLSGATFRATPTFGCVTGAAIGYSAVPQLGGAGSTQVIFPVTTAGALPAGNAGFSVGADTGCFVTIDSADGFDISGITNKQISATVQYKDGASNLQDSYNGTIISFSRGLEDSFSRVGTNAIIDVATESRLFTTNTIVGANTAALGEIFYNPATTTANLAIGSPITTTAVITAATVNLQGIPLGIANSGATVFLDTGKCTDALYTGGVITSGDSTFTITFSDIPATALNSGVWACLTVDGNAVLSEGQISATITNPAEVDSNNYTTRIFNSSNNLVNIEKNGDQAIALVIPRPDGGGDVAFIRITNLSSQTGRILGSLYDEDGNALGTSGTVISEGLAANEVLVLNSQTIATAFGVTTWSRRAYLEIEAEVPSIAVLNLIRSADGTLTNMSNSAQ